jgi:hypothetical protein
LRNIYLNCGKSESVDRSINSRTTLLTIAVLPTPGTPLIYNALQKKRKSSLKEMQKIDSFYPPDCASSLLVMKAAIEFDSCSRHGGASGKFVGKSLDKYLSIKEKQFKKVSTVVELEQRHHSKYQKMLYHHHHHFVNPIMSLYSSKNDEGKLRLIIVK